MFVVLTCFGNVPKNSIGIREYVILGCSYDHQTKTNHKDTTGPKKCMKATKGGSQY